MMHIKTKIPPPLVALTFGFLINYTKDIFPKIEIRNEIIFGSGATQLINLIANSWGRKFLKFFIIYRNF